VEWPRLLAYITGRIDKELLARNEYLAAENRILRAKIKGRLQLSDGEKRTLAEIAHRLGRKALAEVAVAAKPDTILRWFRKLVARKFDGSVRRKSVGRPRVEKTLEDLIVRMAQENPSWGYDRIVGALANLGHSVSDQTVGNVLKRHGIAPAPERKNTTRWRDFIRAHNERVRRRVHGGEAQGKHICCAEGASSKTALLINDERPRESGLGGKSFSLSGPFWTTNEIPKFL